MQDSPKPRRGTRSASALAISAMAIVGFLAVPAPSAAEQKAARAPEQIYGSTCKFCHGHMLAPGVRVAPDLLGRKLDPDMIKSFVRMGPGAMLSFRESDISDRELDALARWIAASPAPANSGKTGHAE